MRKLNLYLALLAFTLLAACGVEDRADDTPKAEDVTVVINEIVSNPSTGEDWVELYNTGDERIYLEGLTLQDDASDPWTFEGLSIAPKAYLVVTCDGLNENGSTSFKFSKDGDTLVFAVDGETIDSVSFGALEEDQSWGRLPNGTGEFQTLKPTPGAENEEEGGVEPSDCESDIEIIKANLILNEVFTNGSEDADWIELYNNHDSCLELGSINVGDDSAWLVIETGTTIEAGAYMLIYADDLEGDEAGLHAPFKLSSGGESLTILRTDETIAALDIPALSEDFSYGRIPNHTGEFKVLTEPTPSADNVDSEVEVSGEFAINEVFSNGSVDADFIEIVNLGEESADLAGFGLSDDPEAPFSWTFPDDTLLAPGDFLVVYADNEDSTETELHASFKVSADGESVLLTAPGATEAMDSVEVPALLEDYSYGRIPNLTGEFKVLAEATPGAANVDGEVEVPGEFAINEVLSNGSVDADYIEIVNLGDEIADLGGFGLSDDPEDLFAWTFPAESLLGPGEYLIVFADNEASTETELHANFKLSADGESLTLTAMGATEAMDSVELPALEEDDSWGRFPDSTGDFQLLDIPTPGQENTDEALFAISINEIFTNGSADPDWIELKNLSAVAVDLAEYTLSDDPTGVETWAFPIDTLIEGHSYLLIYADNEEVTGELHATFKLSASGEELIFADPSGDTIETLTFPELTEDYAYGRIPDGWGEFMELEAPTPGAENEENP